VDGVLGPGNRGAILLADAAAETLRHSLAKEGVPAATPEELGLWVNAASAPGPGDAAGLARFFAEVSRRPAVARVAEGWAVAGPAGQVREGADAVSLVRGAGPEPPRVAVFGGAWIAEDEPEYRDIRQLGRWLAEHETHLVCGGYQGAMAAACRGGTERGGIAIGVTISAWEDLVDVNPWLTHEVVARDLFARLPVITDAEAWVAFSGGVGTLQEVALCWHLVQTGLAEPRPLVLVGDAWDRQMRLFREILRVSELTHFDLVRPAATLEEVLDAIAPAVE
jgi:uncharacterized protein (TIGR00730 family)